VGDQKRTGKQSAADQVWKAGKLFKRDADRRSSTTWTYNRVIAVKVKRKVRFTLAVFTPNTRPMQRALSNDGVIS
jgi:hypothetical protein